jgi:hypothetical protein
MVMVTFFVSFSLKDAFNMVLLSLQATGPLQLQDFIINRQQWLMSDLKEDVNVQHS